MIFNVTVYIKVILKIHHDYGNIMENDSQHRMLMRRLSLYPMILVITYLPISIKRISEIFNGGIIPFWFTCIAACGISLTGFCNSLIYGLTGPVKSALRGICIKEERNSSAYSLFTVNFSESFHTNNL